MADPDINFVLSSPDAQDEVVRIAQGAKATRNAFQTVDTSTKQAFNQRYDDIIGPERAQAKVDLVPLGKTVNAALETGSGIFTQFRVVSQTHVWQCWFSRWH